MLALFPRPLRCPSTRKATALALCSEVSGFSAEKWMGYKHCQRWFGKQEKKRKKVNVTPQTRSKSVPQRAACAALKACWLPNLGHALLLSCVSCYMINVSTFSALSFRVSNLQWLTAFLVCLQGEPMKTGTSPDRLCSPTWGRVAQQTGTAPPAFAVSEQTSSFHCTFGQISFSSSLLGSPQGLLCLSCRGGVEPLVCRGERIWCS